MKDSYCIVNTRPLELHCLPVSIRSSTLQSLSFFPFLYKIPLILFESLKIAIPHIFECEECHEGTGFSFGNSSQRLKSISYWYLLDSFSIHFLPFWEYLHIVSSSNLKIMTSFISLIFNVTKCWKHTAKLFTVFVTISAYHITLLSCVFVILTLWSSGEEFWLYLWPFIRSSHTLFIRVLLLLQRPVDFKIKKIK